jgi:hypothetical protein
MWRRGFSPAVLLAGAMNMAFSTAGSMAMTGMGGGMGGDLAGQQSEMGFRQTLSNALDRVVDGVQAELTKSGQVAKK